MQEKLVKIEQEARSAIECSSTLKELEDVRVKYLGRKGEMQESLKVIPSLPEDTRPKIGQLANEIKNKIKLLID